MIKMDANYQVRLGDIMDAMDLFIDIKEAHKEGMDWVSRDFMLYNKNGEASLSVQFLIADGILVSKERHSHDFSSQVEYLNSLSHT